MMPIQVAGPLTRDVLVRNVSENYGILEFRFDTFRPMLIFSKKTLGKSKAKINWGNLVAGQGESLI